MANEDRRWYGVQFHPEVTHTRQGERILRRFVLDICGCEPLWTTGNIIEDSIAAVRSQVGDDEVLLGCRAAWILRWWRRLLHRAIGAQLTCVFVDTGLLRLHEGDQVMTTFGQHLGVRVIRVDAEERFLSALGRRYRSRTEAQDHRRVVRDDFRGGGAEAAAMSNGWRRAPSIPM
jgi:GMP synthase (glutamine-hydrolysing)